jgi:hypothetical protein
LKIKTTKETKKNFYFLKVIYFNRFSFWVKIKSDYFENKTKKVADEKCFSSKVLLSN